MYLYEYIELYNSGENDCSLQGLGLDYFGGFWQGFIFDDVIIQSGSYYLANNDMDNLSNENTSEISDVQNENYLNL